MEKEEELEIGLLQAAEREAGRRPSKAEEPEVSPGPGSPDPGDPPKRSPKRHADDKGGEEEVEDGPSVGSRIKSYTIAVVVFLLIIAGVVAGIFFNGLRDLRNDARYIIVVQENDVPKAATLYQLKARQSEPFNIGAFPSTADMERFLRFAQQNDARIFDKVVVLNVEAIDTLSRKDTVIFREREVPVASLADYLLDAMAIPPEIKGEDAADWETKSKLLGAWVEQYHGRVWKGEDDYNRLLAQYRASNVFPYPSNGALFLLKILPLERLVS